MLEFIEKFCIDALEAYYNTGKADFFDNIDDNVVWYGPVANQVVIGKANLMKYFNREKRTLKFNIEDLSVKLFPLKADAFVFLAEYALYAYHPDGRALKYDRHMIVVTKRKRGTDGKYIWNSPLIHISDVTPKSRLKNAVGAYLEEGEKSLVDILLTQRKAVKKILLPGPGNSNHYVAEDSIIYVEGGKGVQCYVHTQDEVIKVNQLMKDIAEKLPDYYYRCHASYIVNLRHVKSVGGYKITLDSGEEIPIPAKKYAAVKADIAERIGR